MERRKAMPGIAKYTHGGFNKHHSDKIDSIIKINSLMVES